MVYIINLQMQLYKKAGTLSIPDTLASYYLAKAGQIRYYCISIISS